MRWLVFVLFAWPAWAQEGFEQIRKAPEAFVEEMAGIILTYGGARGLDAGGIERCLDVARAKLRAREMRRFWVADLDGDGTVTAAELAAVLAVEGVSGRGRLWRAHGRADADGDGAVSAAEAAALARVTAAAELEAKRGPALRKLLELDGDGDGFLTTRELLAAVERLRVKV